MKKEERILIIFSLFFAASSVFVFLNTLNIKLGLAGGCSGCPTCLCNCNVANPPTSFWTVGLCGTDKICGDDGLGGYTCYECGDSGLECGIHTGTCKNEINCLGCLGDDVCLNGSCCTPKKCANYPGQCGAALDDGCEGTIDCSLACGGIQICCDDGTGTEICQDPVCDNAGDCPDDGDVCTAETCDNAGFCNASCSAVAIVACVSGDDCCPAGCANPPDSDCASICGDGFVAGGEVCDTLDNMGCSGVNSICSDDCSFCTCTLNSDLIWAGNFSGKRTPIICIILNLIAYILKILGGIFLLTLVLGGIYYAISGSSPDGQKKAKKMVVSAIIGLAIVLVSYVALMIIDQILVQL